jgi:hypothetical protein
VPLTKKILISCGLPITYDIIIALVHLVALSIGIYTIHSEGRMDARSIDTFMFCVHVGLENE